MPPLLLTVFKFGFLGLIYLFLALVLFSVQRELRQHLGRRPEGAGSDPGRLRAIRAGPKSRVEPGTLFRLRSRTNVGSAAGNHIVLDDGFVSGKHARLSWDGHRWWLEDLGSTNGTLLDGKAIPPHVRQPVGPHALLQFGETVLEVVD